MSYIQFQQKCLNCKCTWNAAFGIVGTTYIAQPPTECPYCKSTKIIRCSDHWDYETVEKPTFEDYLKENYKKGIIDHSLRYHIEMNGKPTFYIHPANTGGTTTDFVVEGNNLSLVFKASE